MNLTNYFQPRPAGRVSARVGLISDTHMPERCLALPAPLFDTFQDVDLILHAGDLGELWVLDHLSAIAPVVAVHGNDDTRDAQRELPSRQVVSVAGQRILLWHSHFPDPVEDHTRRGGAWSPKLAHIAEQGRRAGAQIVVFGHFHIPLVTQSDEILLINPGALASGSIFTRQVVQTAAVLSILEDGKTHLTHTNLAKIDQFFQPEIDWQAGVTAAFHQFQSSIVEDNLVEDIHRLKSQNYAHWESVKTSILLLCHLCWMGEKQQITRADLIRQFETDTDIIDEDRQKVMAVLL